jgi:cell division septation protein DedD
MTELLHKKSKEGRYRVEPNIAEIDPVIEPLTDLDDDEDAIGRLLVNTGFDADEDVSALRVADDGILALHLDAAPPFEAFGEDEALAVLQADDDDYVEPVDIGSPLADVELAPEPPYEAAYVNIEARHGHDGQVAVVDERTAAALSDSPPEFTGAIPDVFALPAGKDEASEPDALAFPIPEAGPEEALCGDNAEFEDYSAPSGPEPEPAGISPHPAGSEAAIPRDAQLPVAPFSFEKSKTEAFTQEADSGLNTLPPAGEGSPLLSLQEDVRQRIALLEAKSKNTRRLSYAAAFLSLAGLCAASYLGYLAVQTRAELTKLKDVQSIMEEDLGGLNEKLDSGKQAVEDSAETPSSFTDEGRQKPEGKTAAVQPPPASETGPLQAAARPATGRAKPASEPPIRKTHVLTVKPAINAALPKHSRLSPEKRAAENAVAHWSVNLASFRQIKDARKKAAELRQKGVQVKVTKVDIKHATWYRLNVPGFATKEAASAHSARLKKLLRLNTIWVAAI